MMELPEDSEEYDSAREIYEASEKAKDVVRQISTLSRNCICNSSFLGIRREKTWSRSRDSTTGNCEGGRI